MVEYCSAVVYNDVVDMYYILISCHRYHHIFLTNIEFIWLDASISLYPHDRHDVGIFT